MGKRFTRNIVNTKLRGKDNEPLYTNAQNDLLSDNEDVFVRNKKEYHALTDNIKSISSKNDTIEVKTTGKNTRQLIGKETEILSDDIKLIVIKNGTNDFTLKLDLKDYYKKTEIDDIIAGLESRISNLESV